MSERDNLLACAGEGTIYMPTLDNYILTHKQMEVCLPRRRWAWSRAAPRCTVQTWACWSCAMHLAVRGSCDPHKLRGGGSPCVRNCAPRFPMPLPGWVKHCREHEVACVASEDGEVPQRYGVNYLSMYCVSLLHDP